MSSQIISSYAVGNVQTAIGYDFRHAPLLLLALCYPIEQIPGSSTYNIDALQTHYQVLMTLQRNHPSDKVLADCGRRIDLINHMFHPAGQKLETVNAAAVMKAIIGAIWTDSRDESQVVRVLERLRQGKH